MDGRLTGLHFVSSMFLCKKSKVYFDVRFMFTFFWKKKKPGRTSVSLRGSPLKVCRGVEVSQRRVRPRSESAGRKTVGRAGSRSPSWGSGSERMKPVIREVKGRKLSAGVGIVLGAGGLEGSLVPQITRPPAAIVAQ